MGSSSFIWTAGADLHEMALADPSAAAAQALRPAA